MDLNDLYKAGYGYEVHTSAVSIMGDQQMTFWGCACPLWWIGPSWDTKSILYQGRFGSNGKDSPVLSQTDTLQELVESLLAKAKEAFPEPYILPNGRDSRTVFPNIYRPMKNMTSKEKP